MVISKQRGKKCKIIVDNVELEQVKSYKYLGSWITEDGKCDQEIKTRIGMAKDAFWKQKELLRRDLNLKVKQRILQCYVFSVLTYAAETWTMNKRAWKYIKAFELWCYRRILKVSWKDKITNKEILKRCNITKRWQKEIVTRKMKFAGHTMRGSAGDTILLLLEGKVTGKRGRGRPRRCWCKDLIEWTGLKNYGELKRASENRESWRNMTVNPLIEEDT